MTTNQKIHAFLNTHQEPNWSENVYVPKNGVTKAVSKDWFKMHGGNFNSELYDRVCDAKIKK